MCTGAQYILQAMQQPTPESKRGWAEACLVHDVLLVHILQDVCSDHRMQICLHVLKDEVDVLVILRFVHVLEPAQCSMCVSKLFPEQGRQQVL